MREILIVVSIDVECDKGPEWIIQRPLRFTSVLYAIPNLLTPLFQKYNIKPTYLISPEVLKDDKCVQVLQSLTNCELGTHLHGEFIPPDEDEFAMRTYTPQFLYSPEIEREKLINLTKLFEERLGFRPTSFRAGRFGLSKYTLRFLSELGYLVDSSVTPFWIHNFGNGREKNYWGAPLQPYFPRWDDPRCPGKANILEVPVTILNPLMAGWPKWLLKYIGSQIHRFKSLLRHVGIKMPRTLWLRPFRSTGQEMIAVTEWMLKLIPKKTQSLVLNMMYHSVELIPGASPYAQSHDDVYAILCSQETLFKYLHDHYIVRSVSLTDLYFIWSKSTK